MTTPPQPWLPICTERLLLRDFQPDDFDAIHDYASDPEVARYMEWGPNTPADTQAFLDRAFMSQATWPRFDYGLVIERAADGKAIGSIGLHLRDAGNRTVEIGYCLNRACWRQGLVFEASHALIDLSFRTLDLHRVIATCDVRNAGSYGVMEKLGMRREGVLRQDRQIKGEWRDTYLYAVLAEEWLGCS
jgi:[ribosomal protein S5]-alanine N-acetyltransferase